MSLNNKCREFVVCVCVCVCLFPNANTNHIREERNLCAAGVDNVVTTNSKCPVKHEPHGGNTCSKCFCVARLCGITVFTFISYYFRSNCVECWSFDSIHRSHNVQLYSYQRYFIRIEVQDITFIWVMFIGIHASFGVKVVQYTVYYVFECISCLFHSFPLEKATEDELKTITSHYTD